MAYQALYRKYRPFTFADFVDQDITKKILINSIKNGNISHAYLFYGPRGTGKTSMAKIFAKAINCSDFKKNNDVCNECENCIEANNQSVDIIEIDAASNNGVDEIRDLKSKVSVVPSKLIYKVYIIDEVHMLSNSAFNALLKTLEEPPSHVIFILATTEFYDVPETIVSRCQCFGFERIKFESLFNQIKKIANEEKISITDDAIREIALFSNGGLRDAIGMLDKLHSFSPKKIDIDVYKSINGIISQSDVELFYESVFKNDVSVILSLIDKVNEQGYDFKNFIERVMLLTRDKIVDFYTKKSDICGNVEQNTIFVTYLNDILNKLKETIDPIVIVQVYILSFLEKMCKNSDLNTEISVKCSDLTEKNISREIINEGNNKQTKEQKSIILQKKDDLGAQNNTDLEKNVKLLTINTENKNIRVNNAMATANLSYKKELVKLWKNLNKYFLDNKYGKVAQLLSDFDPMVVGDNYLILTTISEALVMNLYSNIQLVEDLISQLYHHLFVVVLLENEFNDVKKKYIEDRKNNIVYEIQEECGTLINEQSNLISQAIDVFGADMVDIE